MDQPNGKFSKIEMEMALDQVIETLPILMKKSSHDAKLLKKKYDDLVAEGFTEHQALEIIKTRPLAE